MHDDYRKTKGVNLDLHTWDYLSRLDGPQQTNTYDSGAYVCAHLDRCFKNKPVTFSPEVGQQLRLKIRSALQQRIADLGLDNEV